MVKKMNLSEKRKLERRLPLWEAAYSSALPSEKKELIVKIENARVALGMEKFIKEKVKEPKKDLNAEKKERKEKIRKKVKEKNVFVKKIDQLPVEMIMKHFNEDGFSFKEIREMYGVSRAWMDGVVSKYMVKRYAPKKKPRYSKNKDIDFTPEEFMVMKNKGKSNSSIAKRYKTNHTAINHFEYKYLNKYYYAHNIEFKDEKTVERVNKIVEHLNKGLKLIELTGLGCGYTRMRELKYAHVKCIYELKQKNALTPEIYCELFNNGASDEEIMNIYGLTKNNMDHFRKNNLKIVYFLK